MQRLVEGQGLTVGRYTQCSFHCEGGPVGMVHGDDFVVVGTEDQVEAMAKGLASNMQLKMSYLGPGRKVTCQKEDRTWARCEMGHRRMGGRGGPKAR